jgi:CRP-like cAMP-binding protein
MKGTLFVKSGINNIFQRTNVTELVIFVGSLRIFATWRLIHERIHCKDNMADNMSVDNLLQFSLFDGFSEGQMALLRPLFVPCDCHAGTVLFEQGEPAVYFYLVISGEVAIHYKPEDDQAIVIARIKPGGMIGWSAVIGRRSYTSATICTEYTELLRVRGSDLQTLCTQNPETGNLFVDRLAGVVAERLQSSHPQVLQLLENGLRNGAHLEVK